MLIFAGWLNRSQQDVIECLHEENRVLRGREFRRVPSEFAGQEVRVVPI